MGMALGYLFFGSVLLAVVSGASFPIYERMRAKAYRSSNERRLKEWFREMLYALSTSLSSGNSMEQALLAAQEELETVFDGKDLFMVAYGQSLQRLAFNGTVEDALVDLSLRLPQKNIKVFADIFSIANRSGGDLVQIIRGTIQSMNEQTVLEQEIETMMAQKKFEFRLMSMLVPFILIYFKLASPGYLDKLYQSLVGYLILGLGYLLFWGGMLYGDRLTTLEAEV